MLQRTRPPWALVLSSRIARLVGEILRGGAHGGRALFLLPGLFSFLPPTFTVRSSVYLIEAIAVTPSRPETPRGQTGRSALFNARCLYSWEVHSRWSMGICGLTGPCLFYCLVPGGGLRDANCDTGEGFYAQRRRPLVAAQTLRRTFRIPATWLEYR